MLIHCKDSFCRWIRKGFPSAKLSIFEKNCIFIYKIKSFLGKRSKLDMVAFELQWTNEQASAEHCQAQFQFYYCKYGNCLISNVRKLLALFSYWLAQLYRNSSSQLEDKSILVNLCFVRNQTVPAPSLLSERKTKRKRGGGQCSVILGGILRIFGISKIHF